MHIFDTGDADYFRARDECILCELIHPGRSDDPAITSLNCSIVHAIVRPGDRTLPHRLNNTTEIYYIISGTGMMHIDGERADVSGGMAVVIPAGAIQYIVNSGNEKLEFIAVCDPAWKEEDEEILAGSQEDI
jgi:mannose-6-phosphate isomerase-like protein (cupin superfamily)